MCEHGASNPQEIIEGDRGRKLASVDLDQILHVARFLASEPELRRMVPGFIGYGGTLPGHRVLLAVDTEYDPRIPDAIAHALRERGASVDVITADTGPNQEFDDLDEIRVIMRREPWAHNPRRWEGIPWIQQLAMTNGYDLLIHGKGGGVPATEHRYEGVPWLQVEQFVGQGTTFPRDLHALINEKTWAAFYVHGRGGTVHLTDPEGTDLRYTLCADYFDSGRFGYDRTPWWGHVMAHASTPLLPEEDATGVVAGTMSHFGRPFQPIRVTVDHGRVQSILGGGPYGERWRELDDETRSIQYPCFPRPGLFWLWEVALGTNPKIARPLRIDQRSSGGFEWERRRSGIIHVGFGTFWRGPEEQWAAENGIWYGHLHVHLAFPTLVIEAPSGEQVTVVENGHLTALDDPDVRALTAKYGDPDIILREDWKPAIPGISVPGSYDDYARDPAAWVYRGTRTLLGNG